MLAGEGTWESQQILLGFVSNLDHLAISLAEEEIAGANVLFSNFFNMTGSRLITLLETQQLLGHIEHSQSANEVGGLVKCHTVALLECDDEQGMYIQCPDPDVWKMFWESMDVIRNCCLTGDSRRALFKGRLYRLLIQAGRLSFYGGNRPRGLDFSWRNT